MSDWKTIKKGRRCIIIGAKYLLFFVCSLLQILLTKCNILPVPEDHLSPYVVQDAAKMRIELVPNGNEFMSYYIVNHTDQYLECSYWRKLEICNDGEWYEFGGNPWILSSEMIESDGTQLMEDDWLQQYYPELDEGEYRILLHMCFHAAPDEWMTNEPDENDFYIAYEFFVESKNSD